MSDLSYGGALQAIAERGRFGIRLGLGRTRALLAGLGDPHLTLRGALVAGTNGKGSVLALAGSALRVAGYRVGLTPKPHLITYRERLEIDGRPIAPEAFAALVAESPDLAKVFASPAVPSAKKRALAETLASQLGVSPEVQRLLGVMGDRDRLGLIAGVAVAFEARVMQERQILQAEVTTAVPLTSERSAALAAALGRATGGTVKIDARVDPSMLGGVIARVGSTVFDGSVTRQLEIMKTQLINAQNT